MLPSRDYFARCGGKWVRFTLPEKDEKGMPYRNNQSWAEYYLSVHYCMTADERFGESMVFSAADFENAEILK